MLPAIFPLFPLSRVVLFPHTSLPLHIFEPRYRQMISDVLDGDHRFVMVQARDEEASDPLPLHEGFYSVGTLARITQAEALPDGRWNLLVEGECAVKISSELDERVYRQAWIEPLDFSDSDTLTEGSLAPILDDVIARLEQLNVKIQINKVFDIHTNIPMLLNTLAMFLDFQPSENQFLLESTSVRELADRMGLLMAFTGSGRIPPN